jgi:tRNA(Ser,Leu) C12 N-acetylase TAN1
MWHFNLVVTLAADGRFRQLLEELSHYGDFRRTEFFGVILGQVADPAEFLERVREKRARQLVAFQDLGRAVPLESCFTFKPETFQEQVREALAPYATQLAGRRFYVRLERRGLKGRIISPEAERDLDAFLVRMVRKGGGSAEVSFDDPDTVLAVETIGERCGIGLLTRELRERYAFTHVP